MATKAAERGELGEKIRDINLTQSELAKFSKALKDESFRKLLGEYVDEIRDPENRKRYEEEIALLERERGHDITWIHPEPGHVLKLQTTSGGKAFINVCSSREVGSPSCERGSDAGQRGLNWSIPYAQSRPREDRDRAGAACTVYDVIFHPDTLYMAGRSPQMRRLVEQTALQAVEDAFQAGLRREKVAYPKLKYKGVPQASVIRRRRAGAGEGDDTPLPEAVVEELRRQAADLTLAPGTGAAGAGKAASGVGEGTAASPTEIKPADAAFETPKYSVVYRDCVDMQQFAARCGGPSARPQSLVVRIQLPRLTSAEGLDLDVGTRTLKLRSPAGYHLDAVLPLPVLDSSGSATFDRSARCLVVTLPVAPAEVGPDSGIDSDGAKNESDDDAYRTAEEKGEVGRESEEMEREGESEEVRREGEREEGEAESSTTPPTPSPSRFFSLPRFSLHQTPTHFHLSLLEPNVVPSSVRLTHHPPSLTVTATSLGAGLTPLYYRLRLELPAALASQPEVRSEEDRVMVDMEKTPGDWSGCRVGGGVEMEMKEELIPWQADEPEDPAAPAVPPPPPEQPQPAVPPLSPEQPQSAVPPLSPEQPQPETSPAAVAPPARRHSSGGLGARRRGNSGASSSSLCSVTSCDGPLSLSSQSSVEESLQKKGILKKRHCSESSADELLSPSGSSLVGGSLSTYDEAEEAAVKKSVSFSSHVVEKRYRTNSTILHDAARTERQRAKKKRQRAARRHSEGDNSENDELRPAFTDGAAIADRRSSSDGDTSENDEFQSSATDGSTGGPVSQSRKEKKRKNKRKQDRKQKDMLNNELMFDLDM